MKRVWKPLDVNYLRLYQVWMKWYHHPEWNTVKIVAAKSPSDAAKLIREIYKNAQWNGEEPDIEGFALKILQPESWGGGIVDPETAEHPIFGKTIGR